jgi:hypothetical protein
MNTKGISVENCGIFCFSIALLSPNPSGASVAEPADESRAGNLLCNPETVTGGGCTTTESTVVVFLCDESGLQVKNRNRICCGDENPGCNGSKTVSDTV